MNGALVFKDSMLFGKPRKQSPTTKTKIDGDMIFVCVIVWSSQIYLEIDLVHELIELRSVIHINKLKE